MVETEREILREKDEEATKLGERKPFESSRQAEYEDTFRKERDAERVWQDEDS